MCGNENECVEVAVHEGRILTRDSKRPARSSLRFAIPAWTDFLHAVTQGELGGA